MNFFTNKDFENISKWYLSYQKMNSSIDDKNTFEKIQNHIKEKEIFIEDDKLILDQELKYLNCIKMELYENHHHLQNQVNQIQNNIENLKKSQNDENKKVIHQQIEDLTELVISHQNEIKFVEMRIERILEKIQKSGVNE